MENRYCPNCGEAYDSIPKGTSPFVNGFKGWDYIGHKCKDILSPFLILNEEGREFKDKEQELRFRGINHWNEMSYTKIGTFCEKCRQVMCMCDKTKDMTTVKFTDKGDLVATKTEDVVKYDLDALHLEQLMNMIDEFLPEFHPIRHSNSYYYFKNKQKP